MGLAPTSQNQPFRIAQEAIHSAVRHANLTEIAMTPRREESSLTLHIEDNGSDIPADRLKQTKGFGLRNMRERESAVSGTLEIQTASGRGTSIIVRIQSQ